MFSFDRLYDMCKKTGVSKLHLCKLANKNGSYVTDLRRLNRNPSPDIVEIWAAALHTTPAYLMGETDDPSEGKKNKPTTLGELSKEDRELLEQIRAASPEKKAAILALLKDH